jgi:cation diffusion facilitator family transporter
MTQLPSQAHAAQPKLQEAAVKGIRASLITVIVSLVLGVIKVIAGIVGHSYALVADGVESLLDVASGLVVAGSLKVAAKPPDEDYPYGYGKAEPAAAMIIATGLLAAAIFIAVQSVREILRPHATPAAFTLVVLVAVVVTKEMLFRFLINTGQSIDSQAMETDAWHHRSDSLTSLAAFIGISIALWGGDGYEPADDWAALFAAGVIAFNGARLIRKAWREIMDASPPDEIIDDIREISHRVDGVAGIDMCRVRKSGLALFVDIHVEVDGDMAVRKGHEIAHDVKDALLASKHNVVDAVVHIEPFDVSLCPR